MNGRIDQIFLEAINTNSQPMIDSFLSSAVRDTTILKRVFLDDYSGTGWALQTYLDLFNTVWEYNHRLKKNEKRIQLIAVSPPIYWEGIRTYKDHQIFQSSLKSRDHFMYVEILEKMKGFNSGLKAIYLANTRHTYTGVQNRDGQYYWNTGTFFRQWHPGKTVSVRWLQ